MSNTYKQGDTIPNAVLINRLGELSDAVTQGREAINREFDMRIPAELDRDADLVLSQSATRIQQLEQDKAEMLVTLKKTMRVCAQERHDKLVVEVQALIARMEGK